MELYCPRRLDDTSVVKFLSELENNKAETNLCTNYSRLEFVQPFATLLFAIGIRNLLKFRQKNGLKTTAKGHKANTSALSYLKHFGFFQFIMLGEGKKPNEAKGNSRYLPITTLRQDQFDIEGLRLQEAIKRECRRLATVIYSDKSDISRVDMLEYCLTEVVRNVFEHAGVNECYLMAQKWANGHAEIAIVDEGIGLLHSLQDVFDLSTSEEAISIAIKPGITSDTSPENNDFYQNSGFGLFVLSEIGAKLGEFAIASDNAILYLSNNNDSWQHVPIHGTAVKLHVDTNEAEYFSNLRASIVIEGENLAKTIPGARKTASKMSKMNDIIW